MNADYLIAFVTKAELCALQHRHSVLFSDHIVLGEEREREREEMRGASQVL